MEHTATPIGRPLRVAVVDDHTTVLRGVQAILDADPRFQVVATARSHMELAESSVEFDLVILDLYLDLDPIEGGTPNFEALAALSRIYPVLVQTSSARDEDVYDVVSAYPVRGYILKGAPEHELCEALATIAADRVYLSAALAGVVMRERERRRSLEYVEPLSDREAEVLRLVAEGHTDRQIARAMAIAEDTVGDYLKRIRNKIGPGSRTRLALRAFELGYARAPRARRRLRLPGLPRRRLER